MGTNLSEITTLIISLLPVIVMLMVFKWIVKVLSEMNDGDGWGSKYTTPYDDELYEEEPTPEPTPEPEPTKQVVNEVQVKCKSCGADNTELDAFCGYCGSMLFKDDTVKVRPMIIES